MQFNSKTNSKSTTKSNNLQKEIDPTTLVTLKKKIIQIKTTTSKLSIFKGGKSAGKAIKLKKEERKYFQKIIQNSKEFMIAYDDTEIFATEKTIQKLKSFIKKNKNKKFILEISNPTKIISKTIAKQLSINRVVAIKNILRKNGINLTHIHIKLSTKFDSKYPGGYVKIKIF